MTIAKLARVRGYGIFRGFDWPDDLEPFKKYNLIFGWNGTGKSTLGRLFRCLEQRTPPTSGDVVVRIGDTNYAGSAFGQVTHHVRVFNRDFVSATVFPVGGGSVAPIFVLGADSVEKQREVDSLKGICQALQESTDAIREYAARAESALDAYCIDRARTIKEALRSSGSNKYNTYDKARFRTDAASLAEGSEVSSHVLSEEEASQVLAQAHSTPKDRIEAIEYTAPSMETLLNTTAQILRTTVASQAIEALAGDGLLADWARQGLSMHERRGSRSCLFCNQELPEGRLERLRAHFSDEYDEHVARVEAQIATLEQLAEASVNLRLPHRSEFYPDLVTTFDARAADVHEVTASVQSLCSKLIRALQDKRGRPFDELSLDVARPVVELTAIDRLNELVDAHNQATSEHQSRVDRAREKYAMSLIAADLPSLQDYLATIRLANDTVTSRRADLTRLTARISDVEREVVEHRKPAEELNADLHRYLGHNELEFSVEESGYRITRSGVPTASLSEGESTAIALLYFLKSLTDRRQVLGSTTVVLDDPVSSLDHNALFAAFAYIRAQTSGAMQVIVLTHNFTFFKLVREWFSNLRGVDKKNCLMLMLECTQEPEGRSSRIRIVDRFLLDYDSDYHFLFSRLHALASAPVADSIEAYFGAPNIARRVLETFLAFRVPDKGGHNRLWSQMETVSFDSARRSRIYRFLQTHNHRTAVGDADADLTLPGESRAVLGDVLAFMRAADGDHVDRMVAKLGTAEEA